MIDLLISAEVENVQKLGVQSNHTFFIKLRCINCSDITPSAVGISRDMEVEGIRGASVNMQVCTPEQSDEWNLYLLLSSYFCMLCRLSAKAVAESMMCR
jgi:hypothetical protein